MAKQEQWFGMVTSNTTQSNDGTGDYIGGGYTGTGGAGQTYGGYTCTTCGTWVQSGYMHMCLYKTNPYQMTATCPWCGMTYSTTPGSIGHTCYNKPADNSYQILTNLNLIMEELKEMKKRLDKIEEILDEEL